MSLGCLCGLVFGLGGLNRLVRVDRPARQVQGKDDTCCSVTELEELIRFSYSNEDNEYEGERREATRTDIYVRACELGAHVTAIARPA